MALRPRPHSTGELHGRDAIDRHSDAFEGGWSRAQLMRMNLKFQQAMARAPEAPADDGPDRVAKSLLPARRP
jgi:hypothetical protein